MFEMFVQGDELYLLKLKESLPFLIDLGGFIVVAADVQHTIGINKSLNFNFTPKPGIALIDIDFNVSFPLFNKIIFLNI